MPINTFSVLLSDLYHLRQTKFLKHSIKGAVSKGRKPLILWIQTLHVRLQFNHVVSSAIVHKKHILSSLSEESEDVNSDLSWGKESSCDGTEAAASAVEIQSCLDDNIRPKWGRSEGSRV